MGVQRSPQGRLMFYQAKYAGKQLGLLSRHLPRRHPPPLTNSAKPAIHISGIGRAVKKCTDL